MPRAKLGALSGKSAKILMITCHSGPMEPETLRAIGLSAFALLAVLVWAFLIWMACHVSLIILQTLQQIVDLAAISP